MLKVIKPKYDPPNNQDHTRNGCLLLIIDALLILAVLFQGIYALISLLRLLGY